MYKYDLCTMWITVFATAKPDICDIPKPNMLTTLKPRVAILWNSNSHWMSIPWRWGNSYVEDVFLAWHVNLILYILHCTHKMNIEQRSNKIVPVLSFYSDICCLENIEVLREIIRNVGLVWRLSQELCSCCFRLGPGRIWLLPLVLTLTLAKRLMWMVSSNAYTSCEHWEENQKTIIDFISEFL